MIFKYKNDATVISSTCFGFAVMITTPAFDTSVAFCVSENLHHRQLCLQKEET